MKGPLDVISFMAAHLERGDFSTGTKCILIDLNMPTEIKGYRCLVKAIPMHHTDPEQSLMKEIYPEVGRQVNGWDNAKQVEKQIRDAISAAWKDGDPEVWEMYFPGGKKPKNGRFISRVSELLSVWERTVDADRQHLPEKEDGEKVHDLVPTGNCSK